MSKLSESVEQTAIIDVDFVIDSYNRENPELRQLTRAILAEELGLNPQVFTNWKGGKTPQFVVHLLRLTKKGNCRLEDFATIKTT